MKGRLENDVKVTNNIKDMLKDMPEYTERWYLKLRASDHQPKTCQEYLNKIRNFLRFIDPDVRRISPNDIRAIDVDNYIISLQTKVNADGKEVYTSASYQKTNWSALNNFFSFMVKEGLINRNYMEEINRTKESDDDRINEHRILLTKDDFNSIIQCVKNGVGNKNALNHQNIYKNRDMAIFMLFMTTGMRREEIREINIEDIDLKNKKLSIITKGKRVRNLELNEAPLQYIENWIKDRYELGYNKEEALFLTKYGKRMSGQAIYELVDKYCTEALGYHISPHKLRSGFCSILLAEWGDIHAVMKAVGHKRVETTLRYAVTKNDEQKEASDLISCFLK